MDETVGGQTTAELSKRFYAAMQGRSLKLKDDQGNLCSLSLHKCNDWGNVSMGTKACIERKTGKSPRSLGFNQQHEGKTWRAVGCSCLSVHFLVSFFLYQ